MSKNNEKLNEAFGCISPSFLEATAKPPVRKKAIWVRLVAAVVCLIVMVTAIVSGFIISKRNAGQPQKTPVWTDGGEVEDYDPNTYLKYLLLSAEYPVMAKYPGSDKVSTPEYIAWQKDLQTRREYQGAGKNLDGFFKTTITEFLSGHGENNAVYSPLNVYFALVMLAEITDGNSRQQILDLLGSDSIEALRTQAYSIWNANYMDEGTVKSILASSIWLDEAFSFKEDTLNILKEYYYASSFKGDLGTEDSNFALRSWINEQTGGLADRLSDIELDPSTVMAIVTTIYFSARWSSEFNNKKNTNETFHSPVGDIECDFMNEKESGYYYWGKKFGAVEKELKNSGSMWFILPDKGVSIDSLLSDGEMLSFVLSSKSEWRNRSKSVDINLSVPKFEVQSDMDLIEGLKNLGITDCFDPNVVDDYSPITDTEIYLNKAQHGAGVKIDEEGIIASAFTILGFKYGGGFEEETIDFVLDRPFIFVITGNDGLPLFVGVVNQP